jgi:hypothetical protein
MPSATYGIERVLLNVSVSGDTAPRWSRQLKTLKNYATAVKHFDKGKYHDTLAILNRLLDVSKVPKNYALLGATLLKLEMKAEAAQAFELASRAPSPNRLKYIKEAMRLHMALNNDIEALRIGGAVLQDAQTDTDLAYMIGGALHRQKMEGLDVFRTLLARSSNIHHRHLAIRTINLVKRSSTHQSLPGEALELYPEDRVLRNFHLTLARDINDYDEVEKYQPAIEDEIARGDFSAIRQETPLFHMRWCGREDLNYIAGLDWGQPRPVQVTAQRRQMPHSWGKKIRIGYLSADFWSDHAVMKAVRGVFEAHDREKFDITLFCSTTDEHLESNTADRNTWGKVVEIRDLDDAAAARVIKNAEIDILVDLQGYTTGNRLTVMNHLTAPVHVTWLGYPGTVVNADIDYMICDKRVVPEASAPHYHEKLCWMPETFFPNDAVHRPLPRLYPRKDVGLPEDAFVFSCFHTHWKYSRETVDLWIRILKETPESYLFIVCRPEFGAPANLLKRFTDAGLAKERVLFANRVGDFEKYLSRIALTDLGLDTYPYNGHTTTSEKLWCGLPMLTHKGTNFASRVSESLLNAVGLPELVADDMDDYVRRAVDLYNNRDKLQGLRDRLAENRFSAPLFDAERFCRHLETAYEMMADRAKAGLAPANIEVPALPARQGLFSRRTV